MLTSTIFVLCMCSITVVGIIGDILFLRLDGLNCVGELFLCEVGGVGLTLDIFGFKSFILMKVIVEPNGAV